MLPVIDIAPFLNRDPNDAGVRASTAAALHNACVEYGFFYLDISAYVDPAIPAHLAELGREFFHLPQAEKDRIALKNEDGARGYARLKENVTNGKADNHEGIDFYKPVEDTDKTRPLGGVNQWPEIYGFREGYEAWVEKMKVLGMVVMEAMALGLGMTFDEWSELKAKVDDSFWVMRVIGYPPLQTDDEGFSCGAHKDYGCLTFLYADPTPSALQVFSSRPSAMTLADPSLAVQIGSEKGVWINADPIPGCVVDGSVGDMDQRAVSFDSAPGRPPIFELQVSKVFRRQRRVVSCRVVSCLSCSCVRADDDDDVCVGYRMSYFCFVWLWGDLNFVISIPFFFEPNFDADIRPLAAVLRLQQIKDKKEKEQRASVVYGEFLLKKVGNNFADGPKGKGKGKYD